MKVTTHNERKVEAHGDIETLGEVSIKQERIGKFFSIVTEKLYEDPIRAVTREIMTNMVDAWMQARSSGRNPQPGVVALPSAMRQSIRFIDYGPGMSLDEIKEYVLHILESSKDQGNEFHGGWGLGLKSPFSYAKSWTIESRQDGTLYRIATLMKESGVPSVEMIGKPEPTDEPDGLTVEIPVKRDDAKAFRDWALWYAAYLPPQSLKIPGLTIQRPEYDSVWQGSLEIDGDQIEWKYRKEDKVAPPHGDRAHKERSYSRYHYRSPQLVRVVLGHIVYINLPGIDDHPIQRVPLDLTVPIGYLQVTPDRDRLVASNDQVEKIRQLLDAVRNSLKEKYTQSLKTKPPIVTLAINKDEGLFGIKEAAALDDEIELDGFKFTVLQQGFKLSIADAFQRIDPYVDGSNPTNEDDVGDFEIRWRDYRAPSTVEAFRAGDDLAINHNFTTLYYDDVGHGAIDRFKRASLNRVMTHREKRHNSRQAIALLAVQSKNHHARIARINKQKVAKAFGLLPEMVKPLSSVPKDKKDDGTFSAASISTAQTDGERLWRHTLVSEIRRVGYNYVSYSWTRSRDPADPNKPVYYVQTSAGSFTSNEFPDTTGKHAAEDWQFLAQVPDKIWDVVEEPVLFAPGTVVSEFRHLDHWKNFFVEFDKRVATWLSANRPSLSTDHIIEKVDGIYGDVEMLHGWLMAAADLIHEVKCRPSDEIVETIDWASRLVFIENLVPGMRGCRINLLRRLLEPGDTQQRTRDVLARLKRVTRRYPVLPLTEQISRTLTNRRSPIQHKTPSTEVATRHLAEAVLSSR